MGVRQHLCLRLLARRRCFVEQITESFVLVQILDVPVASAVSAVLQTESYTGF